MELRGIHAVMGPPAGGKYRGTVWYFGVYSKFVVNGW
jgi:hypothetical protein